MASLEPNPTLKRQRDDQSSEQLEEAKKHKSYNHILSILDDDEDDPTHDLSSLISTLHRELSGHFPTEPEANSTGIGSMSEESSVSAAGTDISGHFPTETEANSTGIASMSEESPESSVSGAGTDISGPIPTDPEANSTGIASNSEESSVSGTGTELSGHFPTDPDEKSTGIASNSEDSSESSVSGAGSDISGPIPTYPGDSPTGIAANSEDSLSESSVSGEKERVMRHLLEASDDELGIPTVDLAGSGFDGGDGFGVLDGLWEFGDESEDCFGLFETELLI